MTHRGPFQPLTFCDSGFFSASECLRKFHTDSIQARLPPLVLCYFIKGIGQEANKMLLVAFGTKQKQRHFTLATMQLPSGVSLEVTQVSLELSRSKKL